LSQIRKNATYIIDTSNLTPRQLKEEILAIFVEGRKFDGMIVNIISLALNMVFPLNVTWSLM